MNRRRADVRERGSVAAGRHRRPLWRLATGMAAWWKRSVHLTPEIDFVHADVGDLLVLANDSIVSHTIRRTGAWEAGHLAVFSRLLRPGDTAIDIGANIGHHTVAMARAVGAAGRILAFEPQTFVHRVLVANLALNRCDHVEPYAFAVGDVEGHAWMTPERYDDRRSQWNVGGLALASDPGAAPGASAPVRVRIARLDDVVADRDIAFIKSDAQGCDCLALRGGRGLLARCRPFVLMEIAPQLSARQGCDYREVYDLLESLGYRLLDPLTFAAAAPRAWSGDPLEEWDILAVHPAREDRLHAAAPDSRGWE